MAEKKPLGCRWWTAVAFIVAAVVLLTRIDSPSTQLSSNNNNNNQAISGKIDDIITKDPEEKDSIIVITEEDTDERDNTRPSMTTDAKREWPELVGKDGEEAKQTILSENPSVTQVYIIPEGSMVTMDYREDRVWVFVDTTTNKVVSKPQIG